MRSGSELIENDLNKFDLPDLTSALADVWRMFIPVVSRPVIPTAFVAVACE